MADLEAVLADVSYLMAMEKSKQTPAASASKKIVLPDRSIRSVMHRHLQKMNEHTFEKIFNQQLGFLLFKDFCNTSCDEPVPQLKFYEEIKRFEKLETDEERWKVAKEIYDQFIMKELLSSSHTYSKKTLESVQYHLSRYNPNSNKNPLPSNLFEPYKKEISDSLSGRLFEKFAESEKYTRFCQWKNFELNIQLTMNDFSVHRIIGRGGFGEVYGCRKADTGKMYAMKCLDKKRIKMKQGESLALNERIMLSSVSNGDGSPFIVCMSYAFHTPDKLCFILDLMNGGDLHYHLSQHGVFSEKEVKFYAAEVILGLEHMHSRFIVYRDLKPANILLDEHGHVRISDLGLACDYSKKKPHASVGTHGYMAPEVLAKGVPYDSSADWFSFGCMVFKLIKGHSPFRQHKIKDKHEIDKMTMTMSIELPDSIGSEIRNVLEGLLARDVDKRLGCLGRGADEVKEHPFFRDVDWKQVYLLKYPPPLVPPRGEVNAADAFDIGNFDEDDTKGIKLSETDQEIYKDFPIVISERWQQEIVETVFDTVNADTDKLEQKRRAKMKQNFYDDEKGSDLILQGQLKKNTGTFGFSWQTRYAKLYPNRVELYYENKEKDPEVYTMERIESIESKEVKGQKTISIHLRNGSEPRLVLSPQDHISYVEWFDHLETLLNEFKLNQTIADSNNNNNINNNLTTVLSTPSMLDAGSLQVKKPTSNAGGGGGGAKINRKSSSSFSNMEDLLHNMMRRRGLSRFKSANDKSKQQQQQQQQQQPNEEKSFQQNNETVADANNLIMLSTTLLNLNSTTSKSNHAPNTTTTTTTAAAAAATTLDDQQHASFLSDSDATTSARESHHHHHHPHLHHCHSYLQTLLHRKYNKLLSNASSSANANASDLNNNHLAAPCCSSNELNNNNNNNNNNSTCLSPSSTNLCSTSSSSSPIEQSSNNSHSDTDCHAMFPVLMHLRKHSNSSSLFKFNLKSHFRK